jgi:hypothetical protein
MVLWSVRFRRLGVGIPANIAEKIFVLFYFLFFYFVIYWICKDEAFLEPPRGRPQSLINNTRRRRPRGPIDWRPSCFPASHKCTAFLLIIYCTFYKINKK